MLRIGPRRQAARASPGIAAVFAARPTYQIPSSISAIVRNAPGMSATARSIFGITSMSWTLRRNQPRRDTLGGPDIGSNGRIWVAGARQIGCFEPGAEGRPEDHSLMSRPPEGATDPGDACRGGACARPAIA